ncbi:hypothetical protein KQX54_019588 [Cotesia glomerata]|uniref:Uncharacterized protein n=1 Tax=Cotesia glomerata TaxID=32391 RepID=A0AAV7I4Q9_COTGL|nr:hypothetical protein KQX54_019588 [Cotesia glomerata]
MQSGKVNLGLLVPGESNHRNPTPHSNVPLFLFHLSTVWISDRVEAGPYEPSINGPVIAYLRSLIVTPEGNLLNPASLLNGALLRKRIREKDLFEKDKERKTNVTTTTSTTTVTSIRWRLGELRYRATTERKTPRGYAKEGERGGGNRKRLTPDERRPTPR